MRLLLMKGITQSMFDINIYPNGQNPDVLMFENLNIATDRYNLPCQLVSFVEGKKIFYIFCAYCQYMAVVYQTHRALMYFANGGVGLGFVIVIYGYYLLTRYIMPLGLFWCWSQFGPV